ncbi:AAA family ATPase [Xanthomonas rydalmerensis]|uniref:AAA family ATPase n=1 Tax=Xanthomonas rydalmerensis TaxID=3046274 RepID=A0ABZ0JH63_9XANT|nr:AAA family ATPase [Xanthomonas sp. DM-2023]WOS39144.1 AAA family ATPase [Xanthomonas sp. DM-2023]WOS43327.1 AAA family ATPase [Xanthomonas sp. DM-2023]WOS47507.1 AAA family ATPase [Xanthomonas sp. DM-2023]WOS51687.1 AAA family ATPase [Xanthomonas sp. DM-2023]WOS55870.1 AAA family ATPase [Xanthomonas sp. DM-2023]
MRIDFIEVANFRKLLATRIDIAKESTVFVGANNSGKTSAMVAMRHFLVNQRDFNINDFTLSHWPTINELGNAWEAESENDEAIEFDWGAISPSLDVWLQVPDNQLHYVQGLLPTLDWDGSAIGVRLRYEPKNAEDLKREYLNARSATKSVMAAAAGSDDSNDEPFSLWPKSMIEFLSRRLRFTFEVKAYLLDPALLEEPEDGCANPQILHADSEPLKGDPFKGLIRIDEISAQRGLGFAASSSTSGDNMDAEISRFGKKLSTQLRNYYSQHLDPSDQPEEKDLKALQALHQARVDFGKQLSESFKSALEELENVGYPGLTDPKLRLAADLRPLDALNHGSALHYEVPTHLAEVGFSNRLPEDSNGLGYQNLVSMVFALMSFRDRWMRVGKASKQAWSAEDNIPPLHLVLVEEPEAHLHAQVQQVFIAHAYAVLRKHESLGNSTEFHTQMVVSTHSSHLAHEAEFTSLRYFRRMPVKPVKGSVPISQVVNLSKIFGTDDDTTRFVKRYLKITHCDLFFADGAILVEGPAERIVVPHMVHCRESYIYLRHRYLTWLEIGGSHAHRLRPLLTKLGLNTLIVTDLDAKIADGSKVIPARSEGQLSRNQTIKTWVPMEDSIDLLLDMPEASLTEAHTSGFGFRVAYQQPVKIDFGGSKGVEAIANTFEDALVYQNLDFFRSLQGAGLAKKIRESIENSKSASELSSSIQAALKTGDKAEFSMTLLESSKLDQVSLPEYIHNGLLWLIAQLKRKEDDVAGKIPLIPTPLHKDAVTAASEVTP